MSLAIAGCAGTESTGGQEDDSKLVVAIPAEPDTMNVMKSNADVLINWVGPNVVERLATRSFDPDEIVPTLATGWEQIAPTEWEITLREGVMFSNGNEMTAADAVASIKFGISPDSSIYSTYWPTLADARETGDYTFIIETTAVDPVLFRRLPFISVLPADTLDDDYLASEVIGTGPYTLNSWQRGQSIILDRTPDYWGEPAQFESVELQIRAEPSVRADALRTGEADIALLIDPEQAEGLPQVLSSSGTEVAMFKLNTTGQADGSIMTDEKVRLAVNHAIDREALVDSLFAGYAELPHGQLNPITMNGTDPSIEDYSYDPDLAKELLAEAGAEGATVTMTTPSGNPWQKTDELVQATAGYLEAVGLKPEIVTLDYNEWLRQHRTHRDGGEAPDMFVLFVGNEFFDSTMKGMGDFVSGSWLIDDAELSAIAQQVIVEADPENRVDLSKEAWRYAHEHAYLFPLVAPEKLYGAAENIEWDIRPDGALLLQQIHRN